MEIASVLKVISYIGYASFVLFTVLTVIVFVKYDIKNVFGFLSGHIAAKRIAEMEYSSGNSGNYSKSRVKSNSLFRKNTGKNESTNRLKTDHLVRNSDSRSTEKLEEKSFVRSNILNTEDRLTEPLGQKTDVLHQDQTEPMEQKTEVLCQDQAAPLEQKTEVLRQDHTGPLEQKTELLASEQTELLSNVWESGFDLNTLPVENSANNDEVAVIFEELPESKMSRSQFAENNIETEVFLADNSSTEMLTESYGTEEALTQVLNIDVATLSGFSENDLVSEKQRHQTIHKEVVPGFIVIKEIVLTHTMDRIPRS